MAADGGFTSVPAHLEPCAAFNMNDPIILEQTGHCFGHIP